MQQNQNKVAVVTGANRGIGFETCRQLGQLGFLTILTSRDEIKGQNAARYLTDAGLDVRFHQLDVADSKGIMFFKEIMVDKYQRCDVLVNNAGVFLDRGMSILDLPEETLLQTLQINTLGALKMCQAILPMMQRVGYGRIVNVSSGMGSMSSMSGGSAAYKLSKLMMNGMTRIIASEIEQEDIKINTMAPGWVRSDMGGSNAPRTLAQGADTIIWLATLPEDGPSGGFYEDRLPTAW